MNILVSACLLGVKCRYDGEGKKYSQLENLPEEINLIPVCPEQLGGLPTPRPKSEKRGERVFNIMNQDVTENFKRGAEEVLFIARKLNCKTAFLKEQSPSCGKGKIYNGEFKGILIEGDGVCAKLLSEEGIRVMGESGIEDFLKELKK